MKKIAIYISLVLIAIMAAGCVQHEPIDFASSDSQIEIDAVGGVRKVNISAEERALFFE